MATSSAKGGKGTVVEAKRKPVPPRVLVVELEEAVDSVRDTLCRALSEKIPDADSKKIESALMRFGLCAAPEQASRSVLSGLGVRATSHDDIVAAVQSAILEFCAGNDCRLRPAVKSALDANANSGGALAFLTSLAPEPASRLVERLGIAGSPGLYSVGLADGGFPTPEQWRRAARDAGGGAPAVALVASRASCKTALIAGLRCVVVPDRFTAAQDFGGADAVIEGERITSRDFAEVL